MAGGVMLRIIADENIPFAREAFSPFGSVAPMPARAITSAKVRDADVLLVRSVTRVDAALLAGSSVRFVGSASIGADHIDIPTLEKAGIAFHHAPGSNADSVVEYVIAALLALCARREVPLRGRTLGIVGCGNIGSRVAARLSALGMNVLRNDPPLAEAAEARGEPHPYLPLERVLAEGDVISLHVPLTRTGPHPTHHLLAGRQLDLLRPGTWLLNTSRGAVIATAPLRAALASGRTGACVLDVWEHEPAPDPDLLLAVDLATPHIAGHSFDGKLNGTIMLHDALAEALGVAACWDASPVLAMTAADRELLSAPPPMPETEWLHALVRQMYDVESDDARTRGLAALPPEARAAAFHELRRQYPRRRTFARHLLREVPPEFEHAVREGLRVQ